MQVLVVDDETFLAELVKLALEADGHACHTASTIEKAAEIVHSTRIDLVALDLIPGGQDPLDWIEDVVLAFPELHGRVFILTRRPLGDADARRIGGCGARVMLKPFTLHGLRQAVSQLGHIASDPRNSALPGARPLGRPFQEDP